MNEQPPKDKRSHLWERDELDWYVEPERATEALLTVERFAGRILDPACGQGNIIKVLAGAGYQVGGRDIVNRADLGNWWLGKADFFERAHPVGYDNIVCNPPFFKAKGAEAFCRRALEVASAKICMFVDIRFIAGSKRANGLFLDHPPNRIWVITPRVSCPPGLYLAAGNKAGNGSSDWCWLVWDLTTPYSNTSLGWLRRS